MISVRRTLHGDKGKIAAYMAGEVDPLIRSPKLMTKIRNASLMPARLANLPIMQAGLLVKILTMNFCMVIDWIGAGNKTPDAAHLCMFYSAPTFSTSAASNNLPRVQNVDGSQGCNREVSSDLDGHVSR